MKRENPKFGIVRKGIVSRTASIGMLPSKLMVRPRLKYHVEFWIFQLKKKAGKKATKIIKGLEDLS